MVLENLDQKDKEVISAMVNGVSDEDIKAQLEVDDAKLEQLRPVVEELLAGKPQTAPAGNVASSDANSAQLGSANMPEGNQGADDAGEDQQAGDASNDADQQVAPKHIITQEDLDNNPNLVEEGLKVGDEIDAPVKEEEVTE